MHHIIIRLSVVDVIDVTSYGALSPVAITDMCCSVVGQWSERLEAGCMVPGDALVPHHGERLAGRMQQKAVIDGE